MTTFQLSGIDPSPFEPLFALDDAALRAHRAVRRIVDAEPGFPCRASLEDARVGEEVLLLPFAHLQGATPYRASGPIFVRRGARRQLLAPGVVPPYVTRRLMSLRAYDAGDLMIDATVCEGTDAAAALGRLFEDPAVAFVHLHNAKRGCYSCRADRVA